MKVAVPVNPSNLLGDFLSIIYSIPCDATFEKIPSLLKIAVFYESETITRAMRHFVAEVTGLSTVLPLMRAFIELGLTDDAIQLAPLISSHFIDLISGTSSIPFTLTGVYDIASPKVFAAILSDAQVQKAGLTDDDKVRIIDEFVARNPISDPADREALASVVSWTEFGSFLHVVRHDCGWLPERFSRPLLSRIIETRRTSLARFEADVRCGAPAASRWYSLAWLQSISDARARSSSPVVDVAEFVATFGGFARTADPCAFGFCGVFHSVEPFAAQFDPRNLFAGGKYFMARKEGAVNPMVGIDFGRNGRFVVNSISIETNVPPRGDPGRHAEKPTGTDVVFKATTSVQGCYQEQGHFPVPIRLPAGRVDQKPVQIPEPASVIAVEFTGKNSMGADLARLYSFDVEGYFTNR
jgi:hypothetical protein